MTLLDAMVGEWRRLAGNSGAMLVMLGGVVFYALFYPSPYQGQVVRELRLVVVDADHSALSRQLVRMADATDQLELAAMLPDRREAERWLRDGRAHALIEIPSGFQRRALRGEFQAIGAYANAAYFLVYSQAAEGLNQAIASLNAGVVMGKLSLQGAPAASLMAQRDPAPLVARPLFNPAGGYANYVVPAVLMLILQQTLLIGLGLLGRPAPVPAGEGRAATLLGRALVYVGVHAAFLLFFLGVVYNLYHLPQHASPLTLGLFLLPFSLAVSLLGMLLASLFRSPEFTMQALLLTSIPAIFLSGFSWPVEAMAWPLRALAQLLPSTHAIDGFVRLNQMGAQPSHVAGDWLAMIALAVGYGGLLAWRVGRTEPSAALPAAPFPAIIRQPYPKE